MDHLGAALALGLGLAGDRADHRVVQVDMLDLDVGDLDAPGVGLRVEDLLDVEVERSRSDSRSSSSCLPSTARSVVCASWLVASRKFSTWMIALRRRRRGSTAPR
jgi:hypothetical protein